MMFRRKDSNELRQRIAALGAVATPPITEGLPAVSPLQSLQAIVALGGIQLLIMLSGLARTKVLALLIGPAGFGIMGTIDQIVTLLAHVASLSIPLAALRFLPRKLGDIVQFSRLGAALSQVLLLFTGLATVVAIVVVIRIPALLAQELTPYRTTVAVALLSLPLVAGFAFLQNVLAVLGRFRTAGLLALVGGLLAIVAAYAGVRAAGLTGLYAGQLAVNLLVIGLCTRAVLSRTRIPPGPNPVPAFQTVRAEPGLTAFCTAFHLFTVASPLAFVITRLAVLNFHGPTVTGHFTAAATIAALIRIALDQANRLYLTPLLNRADASAARGALANDYARLVAVAFMAAGLAVTLFANESLMLLYSRPFTAAASFLGLFVVAEFIGTVSGVYIQLLLGVDDLREQITISVLGHATVILISLMLVPSRGPSAVALALIIGSALTLSMSIARLSRVHSLPSPSRTVTMVTAGCAVLLMARWWVQQPETPGVVVRGLAFMVCGAFLPLLLTRAERRWLLRPWRA